MKERNPTFEKCQTEKKLDLTATINAKMAYSAADLVVIAVPASYDSMIQHFEKLIKGYTEKQ